jgi:hypothetical protein
MGGASVFGDAAEEAHKCRNGGGRDQPDEALVITKVLDGQLRALKAADRAFRLLSACISQKAAEVPPSSRARLNYGGFPIGGIQR